MDFREEIVRSGKRLLSEGLTVGSWGNISIYDRENGLVYVSPSGMDYQNITAADVSVCDTLGKRIDGKKPSIELDMHLEIYKAREDVSAIVHTHAEDSLLLAVLGESVPMILDEAAQTLGGVVKVSDYSLPGSGELARAVALALGSANACLLSHHGAVCVGMDINAAFKVAEVLEVSSRLYYKCLALGRDVEPINAEIVQKMNDFLAENYGQ